MGLFSFFNRKKKKNNVANVDILNDNGLNLEFFKGIEDARVKKRYFKKDGKKDGKAIRYKEDGTIDYVINYKNGRQDGETLSYAEKEVLFRKSIFKNGEYADKTVEYYSNMSIRFDHEIEKDKFTFYSKNGQKKFVLFVKIEENSIRSMSFSTPYIIYRDETFNPGRHDRYLRYPTGVWQVFDENDQLKYDFDFTVFDGVCSDVFTKRTYGVEGLVKSEDLRVTMFDDQYFSQFNTYYRKSNLDVDVRIDEIIEYEVITLDNDSLSKFIQYQDETTLIYAFSYYSCAMRFLFDLMYLNGDLDSFKAFQTSNNDFELNPVKVLENSKLSISCEKTAGKYSMESETYEFDPHTEDLDYVVTIKYKNA